MVEVSKKLEKDKRRRFEFVFWLLSHYNLPHVTTKEAGHVGFGKVVVLKSEYTGSQKEAPQEKVN